jgi:hypothetical protein
MDLRYNKIICSGYEIGYEIAYGNIAYYRYSDGGLLKEYYRNKFLGIVFWDTIKLSQINSLGIKIYY